MTLRCAELGDVAALDALERRLFEPHNFPISRRMFRHHLTCNLLYAAFGNGGELLGYVLVLTRGRKRAKLYSLGVDERVRGQGIAGALLDFAIDALHQRGFREMVLEVRVDNIGAIALYEKRGFKPLKHLKHFYRDGCDALLMERVWHVLAQEQCPVVATS